MAVWLSRDLLHAAPPGGKKSLQIRNLLVWQAKSCTEANLI